MKIFTSRVVFLVVLFSCCFLYNAKAADEVIAAGSIIIRMDVQPQTVANGLKPYGLVFQLVKDQYVPVKWVINPTKGKDGTDFTHNGKIFRGGPFIVPAAYRTAAVNALLYTWRTTYGVVLDSTVSNVTVPVYLTLNSMPKWTLNTQNVSIGGAYLVNSGIPLTEIDTLLPGQLNCCNDIYIMPHADPTWYTHQELLTWNQTCKGSIFAGCHAVSVLENIYNPANKSQKMNFLLNDTLQPAVPFGSHSAGGLPPSYVIDPTSHSDPPMQFLGRTDTATQNGSEQIYLPSLTSSWRSTTKVAVYDGDQVNIPTLSAGKAAQIAYGYGKGDASRGRVMYIGGHSLAKTTASYSVAGQRAVMNFSFWAAQLNAMSVTTTGVGATMPTGVAANLSANVTGGSGSYTYLWTSNVTGTFSAPTSATTTFTPSVGATTPALVNLKVTDACGRTSFDNKSTTIIVPNFPVAVNDVDTIPASCGASISKTKNVLTNDSDADGDMNTTVTLIGTGFNGTFTNLGSGDIQYTPNLNYSGSDYIDYIICDATNGCDTARLTIYVGTPDPIHGCFSNQSWGVEFTLVGDSVATATRIGGKNNVLGSPDTLYATMDSNISVLSIHLEDTAQVGDTVIIYWQANANNARIAVRTSTNNTQFANTQSFLQPTSGVYTVSKFAAPQKAIYIYIKDSSNNNLRIDAVEFYHYSCLSKTPSITADAFTVPEDSGIVLTVMSNDTDPFGETLTLRNIISAPTRGKVSTNLNGTISYHPFTDSSGVDQFTYRVCNTSGYCADAVVTVTVLDDGCSNGQYKAYGFSAPVTLTKTTTAADAGKDTYIRQDADTTNYDGAAKLEAGNKDWNKRHALLYFDVSSIPSNANISSATLSLYSSKAAGATVTYDVHPVKNRIWTENQATWNVYSTGNNWTTAGGDTVTSPKATATFTSAKDVTNSFDVANIVNYWLTNTNYGFLIKQAVESGGGSQGKKGTWLDEATATASRRPTLSVTYTLPGSSCINIPRHTPLALVDFDTTNSTTAKIIDVIANDWDVDTSTTISLVDVLSGSAVNGTAVKTGSNVTFTPTSGYNGQASFKYIIKDPSNNTDTAFCYVWVTNSAPVAVKDTAATPSGTQVKIRLKGNDSDPEGGVLASPIITRSPSNGIASIVNDSIYYTPISTFSGFDTIIYEICEAVVDECSPETLCDTALVVIRVTNQAPVANWDSTRVNGCQTVYLNVMSNDTDPENGTLTLTIVSGPFQGSSASVVSGMIQYQSNLSNIRDSIVYRICDDGTPGLCDTGIVYILVRATPVNNKPVAVDDADTTTQTNYLVMGILENDSDPDNDILSVRLPGTIVQPSHGTISWNPVPKILTYTPNPYYIGLDSFEYIIADSIIISGGCTPATQMYDTAMVRLYIGPEPSFITGTVYRDGNGLQGTGVIDGTPMGEPSAITLYAYLVDSSGFVASYCVVDSATGKYYLSNAGSGLTYTVRLSSTFVDVGGTAPVVSFPTGWASVGENYGVDNYAGTGNEAGTPNSQITVTKGSTTVSEVNFGIEVRPTSLDITGSTQLNPGYTNTVQVPGLAGTDPEDGTITQTNSFKILTLPTNATIYYNGVAVTANQVITYFDSTLLRVDPMFNGSGSVSFTYSAVDSAGITSTTPGTITMPFGSLTISGTVFDDGSGLTNSGIINGTVIGNPDGTQLYVNIIDSVTNLVRATVAVNTGNGTYTITDSINANTGYRVQLTSVQGAIGAAAPALNLPTQWAYVGEQYGTNNNDGSGIEAGTPNGSINLRTTVVAPTTINFGIDEGPTAFDKSYAGLDSTTFNYESGDTVYTFKGHLTFASGTVDSAISSIDNAVKPGRLSGADPEDGAYSGLTGTTLRRTVVITTLPNIANDVLAYNNGRIYVKLIPNPTVNDSSFVYWNAELLRYELPNFNDTAFSIFIKKNGHTSVSFQYGWLDSAGVLGSIATYSISSPTPLPVTLVYFNAILNGKQVNLEWQTASEMNTDHFEVERSANGDNFESILSQPAAGSSNSLLKYFDIDKKIDMLSNHVLHYRLVTYDTDNTFAVSKIEAVNINATAGNGNVRAWPIPFTSDLNISIATNIKETATIVVEDINGKKIYEETTELRKGINLIRRNELAYLPAGTYILTVTQDIGVSHIQLIKAND